MHIRPATTLDTENICNLYLGAFPDGEKQKVSTLAANLLVEQTSPATISLLAEINGEVVGHIAFSPVTIDVDESWIGYILAPLAVKPGYQKRGIGSQLIETGIAQLLNMDVNVVFVYGDPEYYGKFGFSPDVASGYSPPYELRYPFGWQAIALGEHVVAASATAISCVPPLRDPELW